MEGGRKLAQLSSYEKQDATYTTPFLLILPIRSITLTSRGVTEVFISLPVLLSLLVGVKFKLIHLCSIFGPKKKKNIIYVPG
ncbi:hypothetical protein GDO78_002394 [Eleutherodactylus coqui]|uniref:Uncharacterized protein n=1 Tax=Eleutherodactylus coqui TaxID=57060 RepID=A0A8J6EWH1_ELECQ|nr:hypothetical protein GDO78_002394 [Eleutherodactylus coqui]